MLAVDDLKALMHGVALKVVGYKERPHQTQSFRVNGFPTQSSA